MYNSPHAFQDLLPALLLLILAAGLRVWQIDRVPPGLHDDEVIDGEIVENDIFTGHPAIFYTTGGREGLFHLTLAVAMRFIGYSAIGFRYAGFSSGILGLAATYALANRLLGPAGRSSRWLLRPPRSGRSTKDARQRAQCR